MRGRAGVIPLLASVLAIVAACSRSPPAQPIEDGARPPPKPTPAALPQDRDPPEAQAFRATLMRQLAGHIESPRVLDAMSRVPRHLFVPSASLRRAYGDYPLPIGFGQTISQPTIVAIMTQALELRGTERVLEIGTGSGYQAAVLSLLAAEVDSIEIVPELGERSRRLLADLGYANVNVRIGDGYRGWPERAPFDRIIVTAAPPEVPKALLDQVADGGMLVAPVGEQTEEQRLIRYQKRGATFQRQDLGAVRFVPMVPGKD